VPTLLSRKYKPFFDRTIADHRSSIYFYHDSRLHYAPPAKPQFFYPSARDDRDDSLIVATSSASLSERATAKPGVSISDDPSSITVSELVAVVLVTDADHVAVGVYETHYSTAGSATRLNSVPRSAKYEVTLRFPMLSAGYLGTHVNANAWRFSHFHDTFIQDPNNWEFKKTNIFQTFQPTRNIFCYSLR